MTTAAVDEALADFPTAVLSDALDELDVIGAIAGVHALAGGRQRRVAGRALTARFEPRDEDPNAYRFGGTVGRPLEQVLQAMAPGEIVVMDLQGTLDASAWGGLASRLAQRTGVRGTVIWGTCRDREEIEELGYPIWCTGTHPRRSRNMFSFGSLGEPLQLGHVTVGPGDLVVGDATGVVCVPQRLIDDVLDLAGRITQTEAAMLEQIDTDRIVDWDEV